jgi:predicted peptidase
MVRILISLCLLALLVGCSTSPTATAGASVEAQGRFVARQLSFEGREFRYQVFVPAASATAEGPRPLLLFLHGSGERGDDGRKPLLAGVGPWLDENRATFPALVVFPQVPEGEEWRGRNARMALAVLDAASAEFAADPRRIYLSGISMGGYGSWELALTRPDQFAALVPICGALRAPRAERPGLVVDQVAAEDDPYQSTVSRLRDVPTWIFHGALDELVPTIDDRAIAAASQRMGANFRYTEYPGVHHNAWDPTYRNPAMWQWLFAQQRPASP